MKDRYAYYPGCLASLSAKELDTSTRAVARKLGVELVEMESTTCCGAGDIHEAKPDYYLHLNARILSQAEQLGCDTLLTICNVCTLNLRQANKRLREQPEELARINENLEQVGVEAYSGGVEVRHLLWEISEGDGLERFKQIAVKSLTGLKVAPFYGCQILRPSKVLGFENPDDPSSLERLIEACGAEPVDYASKVKCCGFPIILAREDVALGEAILPLSEAADAGADVMVTPCPLCHLSLDAWQDKAEKKAGRSFDMPVLHLAQLLGAAAGIREDELKFKRHVVRLPESTKRKLLQPDEVPAEAASSS
jgi:succinate dehydrogenase / fumarate reductase cytochrome b subunit